MQETLLQCRTVQHSDVHMIQRGIESCLFSIFSEKRTVVKQWIPVQYARLCSAHFEEVCFEVDIFSSTNGSRSSTDNLPACTSAKSFNTTQTLDLDNCQIGTREG